MRAVRTIGADEAAAGAGVVQCVGVRIHQRRRAHPARAVHRTPSPAPGRSGDRAGRIDAGRRLQTPNYR